SPSMVLEKVNAIMAARKDVVPALPESTGRECTPEENLAAITRIKDLYGERLAARPMGRRLMGAAYRAAQRTEGNDDGDAGRGGDGDEQARPGLREADGGAGVWGGD